MNGPRVHITSDEIQARIRELAREISLDYEGKNPLLITLLKGAFIFLADLVRNLTIPHEVDFITFSSYRDGSRRCDAFEVIDHLRSDIDGRDIIIIDEIIDTGHTLSKLIETLSCHRINSLRICTLLDKHSKRQVTVPVHYCGFEIPDVFVIGYGLDYRERFRNLLYITELTPELKSSQSLPPGDTWQNFEAAHRPPVHVGGGKPVPGEGIEELEGR
jgi:hypoxanthine phosphoribosyltransferase